MASFIGRLAFFIGRLLWYTGRGTTWFLVNVLPPLLQFLAAVATIAAALGSKAFGLATQVLPGIVSAVVSFLGLFIYGCLLPVLSSIKGVLPRRWLLWVGFLCLVTGPPAFYLVYRNKTCQAQIDARKAEAQKSELARTTTKLHVPFCPFL